jgi:cytoskeletal protein CcmA (bactofilin family)
MFGKKKHDVAAITTLVGTGTTVTGDLNFRGRLHLDGRVVGDVTGEPGASGLTLGDNGVIEGTVQVDDLELNGTIRGDVTVRERVELGPTARIDGNLSYQVLEMAAGASVNGRLIHQPDGPQALPAPEDKSGGTGGEIAAEGDEAAGLR